MKKMLSLLMALGWLVCAALSPIRGAVFAEEAGASPSAAVEEQPASAPDNAAATTEEPTSPSVGDGSAGSTDNAAQETPVSSDEPTSPSVGDGSADTTDNAVQESLVSSDEPASPSMGDSSADTTDDAVQESPVSSDEPTSPSMGDGSAGSADNAVQETPVSSDEPTSPAVGDGSADTTDDAVQESPVSSDQPTSPAVGDGSADSADNAVQESPSPDESVPPTEKAPPSAILTVAPPQDYQPQTWRSTAPTFTLSCDLPDLTGYTYAVSIDGDTPVQLKGDSFTPTQESAYTLVFSLLNGAGEIVAQSSEFSVWLDATPPTAQFSADGLTLCVTASDMCSGLAGVSLDGGRNWQPLTVDENGVSRFLHTASEAQTFDAGVILVRDAAGNAAANCEVLILAPQERPGGGKPGGFSGGGNRGGAGASGSVTRTVSHAASAVTDVIAYDGVALVVEDDAMTLLTLGGETLDLSVRRVDANSGEARIVPFTAELGQWNGEPTDDEDADTLILSVSEASPEAAEYEWLFNGKVSKTLAASGIDYLVLRAGERVTALSTSGFTAGRAYDGFRSAGVASKGFEYRLRMADDEREPLALTVTVEDEQFLVTENPSDDFYYYDLYTGSQELLNTPFGTYSPMG